MVFGVQKIFNLACGSFYALGAYVGVSAVDWYVGAGGPPALFIVPLALAGLAVGAVGVVVERGLLRFVYDRDETFQLLMTFAIVLMMEDAIRLTWGTAPPIDGRALSRLWSGATLRRDRARLQPGRHRGEPGHRARASAGCSPRTAFGRIIRATADNREMAEALGVDMRRVYAKVFTLGTALGTLGGALVIPSTAAMSEMGIELIVEAFAVVVIGGLGSMRGAFVGALVVGILRSIAISVYPELEMLLIYLIVIAVLVARPRGALRRSRRVKTALAVGLGVAAIAAAPLVASTYHVLLMLPFMAYAIVLLGLNLLFGYTGLVSFGSRALHRTRRLRRRVPDDPRQDPLARGDPARRRGARRAGGGAGGGALRALREDLLRHADPGLRHALLHVRPEVLSVDRRRRGHAVLAARPCSGEAWTRCRRSTIWSGPTITTRWQCWPSRRSSCGASSTRRSDCA